MHKNLHMNVHSSQVPRTGLSPTDAGEQSAGRAGWEASGPQRGEQHRTLGGREEQSATTSEIPSTLSVQEKAFVVPGMEGGNRAGMRGLSGVEEMF